MDSELFQSFRGSRADGCHQRILQRCADLGFPSGFAGDAKQVDYLYGGGEHRDIDGAPREPQGRFAQGFDIGGQVPLVHTYRSHFGAAGLERSQQLGIRFAVLLDGDPVLGPALGDDQQLAPRVRLGDVDRDRHAQFPERGGRLGTTGHDRQTAQGQSESIGRKTRSEHFVERPGAYAGEKDHHVEVAAKEPLREREGFLIIFEGNFAHGGGQERLALLTADEFGHLGRSPAFKREDPQTVEGHRP